MGLQAPMNLNNKHLRCVYLVSWYSFRSPFSIYTKKYKHHVYDITMASKLPIMPNLPISVKYIVGQNWIFRHLSCKYLNFTECILLNKTEITFLTYNVRFKIIFGRCFSKYLLLLFIFILNVIYSRVAPTDSTLWICRLTLPLSKLLPPIFFFHQNDRKRSKWDY